ncbi:MAG: hypothetical protein AAFY84_18265 [Pseudomonadota bacterium]
MSIIALQTTPIHPPLAARQSRRGGIISIWYARHQYRRMLRNDLLPQPDSVLADAAITRTAAQCDAHKPFWRA